MIGVFVVSVTFTLIYNSQFVSSSDCKEAQAFLKDSYSGRVQNKFYSHKNHNSKTITIQRNGKPHELIISSDTLFFSFVKIGDSLVKNKNQDFIEIYRSNTITQFKLHFACETGTKPQ